MVCHDSLSQQFIIVVGHDGHCLVSTVCHTSVTTVCHSWLSQWIVTKDYQKKLSWWFVTVVLFLPTAAWRQQVGSRVFLRGCKMLQRNRNRPSGEYDVATSVYLVKIYENICLLWQFAFIFIHSIYYVHVMTVPLEFLSKDRYHGKRTHCKIYSQVFPNAYIKLDGLFAIVC